MYSGFTFVCYRYHNFGNRMLCLSTRVIESRRMRWAGNTVRTGEKRNACNILVGKRDRRRSLGKPRRGWECYNKTILRQIGWDDVDWIYATQDRRKWRSHANTVINRRIPSNAISIFISRGTVSFFKNASARWN